LLATFPSYNEAINIFKNISLPAETKAFALQLSHVMRSFALLRGREELSEGWAAAGLLYAACSEGPLPYDELKNTGANEGFLSLLKLKNIPPMAEPPTASQELGAVLVTAAPLVHLISETMRVQNTAPKNLKVSAIQKRFMDKTFLPSVDRQLIRDGAKQLHWEIGNLTSKAISAIRENESAIRQALKN